MTTAIDVSRLITSLRFPTPGGIERVEALTASAAAHSGAAAMVQSLPGARLFPVALAQILREARTHWREDQSPQTDAGLARIIALMRGETPPPAPRRRSARLSTWARAASIYAGWGGQSPGAGGTFVHVNFFRLEDEARWHFLKKRDAAVFMFQDALPATHPEFFPSGEDARFTARLKTVCRLDAGLAAPSPFAREALRTQARALGFTSVDPVRVPPPVDPAFSETTPRDPRLADLNYAVLCGTIEPRKNHGFALEVWDALLRSEGARAPFLILAGRRGWAQRTLLGRLDRLDPKSARVIEAPDLSTPALAALLASARCLISPSHEEGYGLPIAEALALGVPVIAAENQAYTSLWRNQATLLPLRSPGVWADAVRAAAAGRVSLPARTQPTRATATWSALLAAAR